MQPYRIKSITEYHRLLGLAKPEHPLVSLINVGSFQPPPIEGPVSLIFDFYCISLKRNFNARIRYGQQDCDFDEGVLFCMAPGQLWTLEINQEADNHASGWMIILHPDFLWGTNLAKTIKQYEYFGYSVAEALYLSDKEETMLTGIARYIEQEYHSNIDKFSQSVIIAQLEVILSYTERFYQRQFITRKISNSQIISRVEDILSTYFNSDALPKNGLPPVSYIADQLNLSPGYLSELLKALTGQNTQQHIHVKLIEKAKERLSTSNLSVSEIAYELGFEHLQSFSKLFKAKTNLSPLAFRASFN
ncbi:helix-turn-helix domain-containing protein [Mucilaginibacter paludis]|uniref:Transcriptional regulator, AraC family n=1 Tax=Mucilaginibacter paludis DSM 18603 TaxID=714943 RepID=H1YC73_9SPHI|nr:helix-turn-helix transcriptional regulator [Mucilaginibacter paludis]EHQ29636.1 transcriptional regulator, AraC family [Mucilaginibacter paludis DSM 18603]